MHQLLIRQISTHTYSSRSRHFLWPVISYFFSTFSVLQLTLWEELPQIIHFLPWVQIPETLLAPLFASPSTTHRNSPTFYLFQSVSWILHVHSALMMLQQRKISMAFSLFRNVVYQTYHPIVSQSKFSRGVTILDINLPPLVSWVLLP